MAEQQAHPSLSRRSFLKRLSVGAVGAFALGLPLSSLLARRSKEDPLVTDLPGEGSIFQPRQDQRLGEWLRKHRQL